MSSGSKQCENRLSACLLRCLQPTVIAVELEGMPRSLLLLLAAEQAQVLQGTSGIAAEVAASDLFALAPIKAAVQVHCTFFLDFAGGNCS